MTHHDKARELVERLRGLEVCYQYAGEAADTITALSERVRALEEALAPFSFMDSDEYDDLNNDQMLVIQVVSSEESLMEMTVENFRKAYRALASGGRG